MALGNDAVKLMINDWYMSFIRSGWAVPLAFIVDVSAMLQWPRVGHMNRWRQSHDPEWTEQARRYYEMLNEMRRQPIFERTSALIESLPREQSRNEVTYAFLRFLMAQFGEMRHTYSFNTRDLRVRSLKLGMNGIDEVRVIVDRTEGVYKDLRLDRLPSMTSRNEFGTILQLMANLTAYFKAHALVEFISDEEQLLLRVAGHNRAGLSTVDFPFIHSLLTGDSPEDCESGEPRPRIVEDDRPTDSYEVDGAVGGFIDVAQRKFRGSIAEVLPSEFPLFRYRELMVHRLLNEGVLTFLREDIEHIQEELRVLFCFVVDAADPMLRANERTHTSLPRGLSAYVRARAMAALMIMDVAKFFPREKVRRCGAVFLCVRCSTVAHGV